MRMTLTSPAFTDGDPIPPRFTCEGNDESPPLEWTGVPPGARSLALVCDDPDALQGTWVHWVVYRIPPTSTGLPAEVPPSAILPDGMRQGINDFGSIGYGGPCPPPGKLHHYHFKLYALAAEISLESGATKAQLLAAINRHVIAEAQLSGTYRRSH